MIRGHLLGRLKRRRYVHYFLSFLFCSLLNTSFHAFCDKNFNSNHTLLVQALPLLKAAYDRGLNTWDTANVYSNGVSEEIVGKAIKKYEIPREKVVILTKCHGTVAEDISLRGFFFPEQIKKSKDYVNQNGVLISLHAFTLPLLNHLCHWFEDLENYID